MANVADNCEADGLAPDWYPVGAGQIRVQYSSNPDLEAETAKVLDLGMVFTPTFLPQGVQASVTADYYWISLEKGITTLNDQTMLDLCYQSEGKSHPYCDNIFARTSAGDISGMLSQAFNIGIIETSGMDFTTDVSIPIWKLRLLLGWNANYLISYVQEDTETPPPVPDEDCWEEPKEYAGQIEFNGGTYAHWRQNFQLGVGGMNWRWLNKLRVIGKADVKGTKCDIWAPTKSVGTTYYLDTAATYAISGLSIVLGVDNLMDTDPPFLPEGGQNANVQTYDFIGRFIYGKIGYKF